VHLEPFEKNALICFRHGSTKPQCGETPPAAMMTIREWRMSFSWLDLWFVSLVLKIINVTMKPCVDERPLNGR